jgi:hypothetical protein
MSFDLTKSIRAALKREKGDIDMGAVARRVAMKVPDAEVREVLAELMRQRVYLQCSRDRMEARAHGVVHEGSDAAANGAAARAAGQSRWARHLSELDTVHVVPGVGAKHLRDCTAEDLDLLAADRDELAARTAAVAATYREYAEKVRAAGVLTLGDLPENGLQVAA